MESFASKDEDAQQTLQLHSCTEAEFEEAHAAITEEDAIMDEGVFEHLKKFTSFKYSQHKRKSQHQEMQLAAVFEAQTDALQKLSRQNAELASQLADCEEELRRHLRDAVPFAQEERLRLKREVLKRRLAEVRSEQALAHQQLQLTRQKQQRAMLSDFAAIRKINNEACTLLASHYEGFAWLAKVAARLLLLLQLPSENPAKQITAEDSTSTTEASSADGILISALCELLASKDVCFRAAGTLLQDRSRHGSWRPPQFYWDLFDSPVIARQMLLLYQQRPQDEFLGCWLEDFAIARGGSRSKPAELLQHSSVTSNFSVFTLRLSEELRNFLLTDEREELFASNLSRVASLILHAENAYIYALSLLVFIASWRSDFKGCRRLAQQLTRLAVRQETSLKPDGDSLSEADDAEEETGEGECRQSSLRSERRWCVSSVSEEASAATALAGSYSSSENTLPQSQSTESEGQASSKFQKDASRPLSSGTPAEVRRQREVAAAQIFLLFTNLDDFPRLSRLFRSITRSLAVGVHVHLVPADACDLSDLLQQLMQPFESVRHLLYSRTGDSTKAKRSSVDAASCSLPGACSLDREEESVAAKETLRRPPLVLRRKEKEEASEKRRTKRVVSLSASSSSSLDGSSSQTDQDEEDDGEDDQDEEDDEEDDDQDEEDDEEEDASSLQQISEEESSLSETSERIAHSKHPDTRPASFPSMAQTDCYLPPSNPPQTRPQTRPFIEERRFKRRRSFESCPSSNTSCSSDLTSESSTSGFISQSGKVAPLHRSSNLAEPRPASMFVQTDKTGQVADSRQFPLSRNARSLSSRVSNAEAAKPSSAELDDEEDVFAMPSASQYGLSRPPFLEYRRTKGSPVEPPLSALRETSLLQCLFRDFVNPGLSLQRPHSSSLGGTSASGSAPAFLKYASLLVTLCVRGAYESTARWWEGRSLRKFQTKAAQWQYEAEEDFEGSSQDDSLDSEESEDAQSMDELFEEPEHHVPGTSFRTPQHFLELRQEEESESQSQGPTQFLFNPSQRQTLQQQQHFHLQQQQQQQQHKSHFQNPQQQQPHHFHHTHPNHNHSHSQQQQQQQQYNSHSTQGVHGFGYGKSIQPRVLEEETEAEAYEDESVEGSALTSSCVSSAKRSDCDDFSDRECSSAASGSVSSSGSGSERRRRESLMTGKVFSSQNISELGGEESGFFASRPPARSHPLHPSTFSFNDNNVLSHQPMSFRTSSPPTERVNAEGDFPGRTRKRARSVASRSACSSKLIGSDVYKGCFDGSKLGRGVHVNSKKQQRVAKQFALFKTSVDRYKALALKELLDVYRICRKESLSFSAKLSAFTCCISTNVAASAVLCFIKQQITGGGETGSFGTAAFCGADRPGSVSSSSRRNSPEPLLRLSDGLLLLLKLVVDLHAAKRAPVVDFLGELFVSGGAAGDEAALAQTRMEVGLDVPRAIFSVLQRSCSRRMRIVLFWLYVCKYENEAIAALAVFRRVRAAADFSVWRFFLSRLLSLCGPPYASPFCLAVLYLALEMVETQRMFFKEGSPEARRLQQQLLSFAADCTNFCDAPNAAPERVTTLARTLREKVVNAQAATAR